MNNQQRSELIPCPGCQGAKLKDKAVCHNCKKEYLAEAANSALAGERVPTYEEWIEERIRARVPVFQTELKTARENFTTVQTKAEEKLEQLLTERVSGQNLDLEVLKTAKVKLKEKEGDNIWKGLGGPGIYRAVKIANARLQEAWHLLKDLENKQAQAEKPTPTKELAEPAIEPEPEKIKTTKREKRESKQEREPEEPTRRPKTEKVKGGRNGARQAVKEMAMVVEKI